MRVRFCALGALLAFANCIAPGYNKSAAAIETRESRIGRMAAPGGPGDVVVCTMPAASPGDQEQAASRAATARDLGALRTGLFELCEGYRTDTVSAEAYRSALADFPTLLLLVVARASLGEQAASQPSAVAIAKIETTLRANAALRTLCALPAFAKPGAYPPCAVLAAKGAAAPRRHDAWPPAEARRLHHR